MESIHFTRLASRLEQAMRLHPKASVLRALPTWPILIHADRITTIPPAHPSPSPDPSHPHPTPHQPSSPPDPNHSPPPYILPTHLSPHPTEPPTTADSWSNQPPNHPQPPLSWELLHQLASNGASTVPKVIAGSPSCTPPCTTYDVPPAPLARGPGGLTLSAFVSGLPCKPLITPLCQALAAWALTGHFAFPEVALNRPDLLSESPKYYEKKSLLQEQVARLLPARCLSPGSELLDADVGINTWEVVGELVDWEALCHVVSDPQAVLVMLGFRITPGTTSDLAAVPGLLECVSAFGDLHAPASKSMLTVGGRALSKHCHRDSSVQFWGNPKGPEAVKNRLAADVLIRLLQEAVWMNLHYMPPTATVKHLHVLELRVKEGYGARWEVRQTTPPPQTTPPTHEEETLITSPSQPTPSDGSQIASSTYTLTFRGFLEPQLADGHALGWRH